MPYGVGKRICPGVELADMEMFLVLSNLLATVVISLPAGKEEFYSRGFTSGAYNGCSKMSLRIHHSGENLKSFPIITLGVLFFRYSWGGLL